MEFFYILTVIVLMTSFMLLKKKNEKINFIKWLIIDIGAIYGFNVFIGMALGLVNITSHIWLLSIINLITAFLIVYKSIKNKDYQKYFVRKLDIVALLIILGIFAVMFVKDLYITTGDVAHGAVDSAVHYRAAKHYSDYLKIFINLEDKSFFNFNIMQPGAYINDGIFMNIVHKITKLDYVYIYQLFETATLFMSGLALYASFADKIKTKRGLIGSLVAFALYIYGYPYNSWIYGFSYLSLGIMFVTMLIPVLDSLYDGFDKRVIIPLVVLLSIGLIFSYCLFVPAIFSAICIYCMLKDLSNKNEKKYLKLFGLTTIIVTASLVVVTLAGIGYLFIPSFFIEGQTDLISALKIPGEIYNEKYRNFIAYIPFAIMYAVEFVKRVKNKELTYMDVFAVIMIGYMALLYIGFLSRLVSEYYLMKTYFIIWIAIFAVTIDLINEYVDKKNIRIDAVIMFALFIYLYRTGVSATNILKTYLLLFLLVFEVFPVLVKKIDLSKIKMIPEKLKSIPIKKICISGYIYICLWGLFVSGWVWLKAGHIIGEDEKHALMNFAGIYYKENCEKRKAFDMEHVLNKNEIELCIYARENLKDMTVENTCLSTINYQPRTWAVAITQLSSNNIKYENVIQDAHIYTLEDAIANNENKYIIKISSNEANSLKMYEEFREKAKNMDNIKILKENENGFVAEIIR